MDRLIVRQRNLHRTGSQHVILLADLHAVLTRGLEFSDVTQRAIYYEMYLARCCDLTATFVRGSEFQTEPDYVERLYAMMHKARISEVRRGLPAGLRQAGGERFVFPLTYVLMQCLDAVYLDVDIVLADAAQRKVYDLWTSLASTLGSTGRPADALTTRLAKRQDQSWPVRLPRFDYVALGRDIRGLPIGESSADTRISIHDTPRQVEKKVRRMFAPPPGQAANRSRSNSLLEHFEWSVFPWIAGPLAIARRQGSQLEFSSFPEMQSAYQRGEIHPNDCKSVLHQALTERFGQARANLQASVTSWIRT